MKRAVSFPFLSQAMIPNKYLKPGSPSESLPLHDSSCSPGIRPWLLFRIFDLCLPRMCSDFSSCQVISQERKERRGSLFLRLGGKSESEASFRTNSLYTMSAALHQVYLLPLWPHNQKDWISHWILNLKCNTVQHSCYVYTCPQTSSLWHPYPTCNNATADVWTPLGPGTQF